MAQCGAQPRALRCALERFRDDVAIQAKFERVELTDQHAAALPHTPRPHLLHCCPLSYSNEGQSDRPGLIDVRHTDAAASNLRAQISQQNSGLPLTFMRPAAERRARAV